MILVIDDVRDIAADVIARNATAGIVLLNQLNWTTLYLDHDLGSITTTGLDLLRWAIQSNKLPPTVILTTSNPVGLQNMEEELTAAGYTRKGIRSYIKE